MQSERAHTGPCSNPPGERDVEIAVEILSDLPERSRDALIRYFLGRESVEKIQSDLNLTADQFRNLKASVRARWSARRAVPVSGKPAASESYSAPSLPRFA